MYVIDAGAPNCSRRRQPDGTAVERCPRWNALILPAGRPVLSSAPVGGGETVADRIVNLCVQGSEARTLCDDPSRTFADLAADCGWTGRIVGLMTGVEAGRLGLSRVQVGGARWLVMATVGTHNAHRAGQRPPPAPAPAGTINLIAWTAQGLTAGARAEALALVSESRAAALADQGIASVNGDGVATGTGTDAIAVASNHGGTRYTGYHTDSGYCLALAVHAAMTRSLAGGGCCAGRARRGNRVRSC